MYWQVYLHRTVLSAEHMLTLVLRRAKHLVRQDHKVFASPALSFSATSTGRNSWPTPWSSSGSELDDDVFVAMKAWRHHDDRVLALLSQRLLDRSLFRIELRPEPFSEAEVRERIDIRPALWIVLRRRRIPRQQRAHHNKAYVPRGIMVLYKDGTIRDFAEANDHLSLQLLSKPVEKSFLCPKDLV